MRRRILAFVGQLRTCGLAISVAETVDAVSAVLAAGIEREVLREALAATLVKDEADRAAFDRSFDEAFPLLGAKPAPGRRRKRTAGGGGGGSRGAGGEGTGRPRAEDVAAADATGRRPAGQTRAHTAARGEATPEREREAAGERESRAAQVRRLLALPFREFGARDVIEARELVAALAARLRAALARRERHTRRGRLDFRRTIRAATQTGGVPLRPRYRGRRPGRADLVALCDLSGSVAAASELCLGLIAPAADYFRRVHLFAYVDRLCPVSIEHGHVAPGGSLDLHARSDFGRVLGDLERSHAGLLRRNTVLLVLGDARNNRLPPRADRLRAIRHRVRRVLWLVPEPRERWNTGDSVLALYAPSCDAVLECANLGALVRAVRRVLR
jgi:hypothetical protein